MHKLNKIGVGFSLAATWGLTTLLIGLFSHFLGIESSYVEALDALYPGTGTGPRGVLILFIFSVLHGFISGYMIGLFYNTFCRHNL